MKESIRVLQKVANEMRDVEIPRWPDGKPDKSSHDVKMLCLEVVQANLARELKQD